MKKKFFFLIPFIATNIHASQAHAFYDALQRVCRLFCGQHASLAQSKPTPPPAAQPPVGSNSPAALPPSPNVAMGRTYANYDEVYAFLGQELIKAAKQFRKKGCPSSDYVDPECMSLFEQSGELCMMAKRAKDKQISSQDIDRVRNYLAGKIRTLEGLVNKTYAFSQELDAYYPAGVNMPGTYENKKQFKQALDELSALRNWYKKMFNEILK